MKGIQSFFTILAISLFMISCGDDGGLTLNVTSPNNDTAYSPGDVINITGTATDDAGVVSLVFESDELNFRDVQPVATQPTVSFEYTLTTDVNQPLLDEVKITVSAVDGEGNMISEERTVSIQ